MRQELRQTFMLNLDEKHAHLLNDLREHFRLKAEDTLRLTIRLAHARLKKPDVLVPKFKPSAHRDDWYDDEDNGPV
ncbi:hypothetical protein [Leisingera sp. NJS204]|uniref:hypothetical protein n=1 Tax=Leisingera sp. NJS204 TaxID=2508307 RepID=UPI0010137F85|nr:hypothetical protein [Leisingera sp. NJS204]QAX31078.1 hypothetical protein ETW24_17830 [Leisingera sp. NJS204]